MGNRKENTVVLGKQCVMLPITCMMYQGCIKLVLCCLGNTKDVPRLHKTCVMLPWERYARSTT
jgi:hypothetical protein